MSGVRERVNLTASDYFSPFFTVLVSGHANGEKITLYLRCRMPQYVMVLLYSGYTIGPFISIQDFLLFAVLEPQYGSFSMLNMFRYVMNKPLVRLYIDVNGMLHRGFKYPVFKSNLAVK